jgi:chromosome segregation ATPase
MSEDNAWKVVALALSRVVSPGVIDNYENELVRLTAKLHTAQTDLEYERARLIDTQDAANRDIAELTATIHDLGRTVDVERAGRRLAEEALSKAKELASEYDQEFLLRRSSEESWRKKAVEEANLTDKLTDLLENREAEVLSLTSEIESLNGQIDQLNADKAALCEAIKGLQEAASAPPNATLLAPR